MSEKTKLELAAEEWAKKGYKIESQNEGKVVLHEKHKHDLFWTCLWFLLSGPFVLLYIIYFMFIRKTETITLTIGTDGSVVVTKGEI